MYRTRKRAAKHTKRTMKLYGTGNAKGVKSEIQRRMNDALTKGDTTEMRKIIAENQDLVAKTHERGILTMLLRFAIQQRDDALISVIVDRLSMKRDFFDLMVYKKDIAYNIHLFTTYIDSDLLEPKDIRFMIENNMVYLFKYLDGKFLKDAAGKPVEDTSMLRRYVLPDCAYYIAKIMEVSTDQIREHIAKMASEPKFESDAGKRILDKRVHSVIEQMNRVIERMHGLEYDVILDGGNILHSRHNGKPNPTDLETVIGIVRDRGLRPMVIIHQSHTNVKNKKTESYAPRVKKLLAGVQHMITPAHVNDDLFILLAYLMRMDTIHSSPHPNGPTCNIITRDTYTDHMALFKKMEKNRSTDFGGHLADNLVSFTNVRGNIQVPVIKGYSDCIQVIGTSVYVPLSGPNIGQFEQLHL